MVAAHTTHNFRIVNLKHLRQLAALKPRGLLRSFGAFPMRAFNKEKDCGISHTLKL
jgi:hypothetical protein